MSEQSLRITADELKRRMAAGQQFVILDVRNPQAWAEAKDKAHGALRADLHASEKTWHKIPPGKSVVAYCT